MSSKMSLNTWREGPPLPDAKAWRKCRNVFSIKYKPLESSGSAHRLWKICFGSFVVWLWTCFSLRETCKEVGNRREKWVKRKNFCIPVGQILSLPQGFHFALAFELTFYLGFNLLQVTFDRSLSLSLSLSISLSPLCILGNIHTNLAKILYQVTWGTFSLVTSSSFGLWVLCLPPIMSSPSWVRISALSYFSPS